MGCRVRSAVYGMWSVEYGEWSVECGVWGVECEVLCMECGVWSVEYVECLSYDNTKCRVIRGVTHLTLGLKVEYVTLSCITFSLG